VHQKEVLNGEVGLILEKTLPKIDLLLAAIIMNDSNLMSEHQQHSWLEKRRLFVQALNSLKKYTGLQFDYQKYMV